MSENACFNCSNKSTDAALIRCEVNDEEKWVCVRCLPMLIHG